MFYWIYDYPSASIALLFCVFFVAVAWLGTIFIRPFIRLFIRRQPGLNDLVGYILSSYCVFYGLLLGLLAVATYQNASTVEENVAAEAAALTTIYRDVSSYPDPERGQLQEMLRVYTRNIIDESWPAQRRGLISETNTARIAEFFRTLAAFEPKSLSQQILHAEAIRQFNHYNELRRMRIHHVKTGIPPVMWAVVVVGALLNILIVWMFDMKLLVHLILGGVLAFFIGLSIFLIAAMDNPFRGEVSVGPDAFELVYKSVMTATR